MISKTQKSRGAVVPGLGGVTTVGVATVVASSVGVGHWKGIGEMDVAVGEVDCAKADHSISKTTVKQNETD